MVSSGIMYIIRNIGRIHIIKSILVPVRMLQGGQFNAGSGESVKRLGSKRRRRKENCKKMEGQQVVITTRVSPGEPSSSDKTELRIQ